MNNVPTKALSSGLDGKIIGNLNDSGSLKINIY